MEDLCDDLFEHENGFYFNGVIKFQELVLGCINEVLLMMNFMTGRFITVSFSEVLILMVFSKSLYLSSLF
jgi:hypothetical protein